MRKIFLKLSEDTDLFVRPHIHKDGTRYWHLLNKANRMCVVRNGRICRSILRGVYVLDADSRFSGNKLLTSQNYLFSPW